MPSCLNAVTLSFASASDDRRATRYQSSPALTTLMASDAPLSCASAIRFATCSPDGSSSKYATTDQVSSTSALVLRRISPLSFHLLLGHQRLHQTFSLLLSTQALNVVPSDGP